MYNVLACVSDNCKMKEPWSSDINNNIRYDGPWEPYVRDFDPTLNPNLLNCKDAPYFSCLDDHREKSIIEHGDEDISTQEKKTAWINHSGYFLKQLKHTLVLNDDLGTKWVFLKKYCDTDRVNIEVDKLHEWSWLYAYFMTPTQVNDCKKYFERDNSCLPSEITSHIERYTIYNREYPWAPSCCELNKDTWIKCSVNTGEYEEISITIDDDELILHKLLYEYDIDDDENALLKHSDESYNPYKKKLQPIQKDIGEILSASIRLIWEEEYDASKEKTISISHPCHKLITDMNLHQKTIDGYYFDKTDRLAAFDSELTQNANGVLVRKDILDEFLSMNNFKLVWFVDAEKAVHPDGYMISMSSRWKGLFIYSDGVIEGDLYRLEPNQLNQ